MTIHRLLYRFQYEPEDPMPTPPFEWLKRLNADQERWRAFLASSKVMNTYKHHQLSGALVADATAALEVQGSVPRSDQIFIRFVWVFTMYTQRYACFCKKNI